MTVCLLQEGPPVTVETHKSPGSGAVGRKRRRLRKSARTPSPHGDTCFTCPVHEEEKKKEEAKLEALPRFMNGTSLLLVVAASPKEERVAERILGEVQGSFGFLSRNSGSRR